MKITASRPRAARLTTRPLVCAVAAALCAMGTASWAQTAATPSRTATLPEVKVTGETEPETASGPAKGFVAKRSATATKTDTPLAETPQSVSVVTRAQLGAQAAESLDEALGYVSGVFSQTGGVQRRTSTGFTVRGFNITGSAPLYMDGSKFPINSLSGTMELAGFERVELLKGPSSILYGQAAPGGLINMVTKKPTTAPLREIELQTGSWGRKQLGFDFGGPIGEQGDFGYRISGVLRNADAMIEQIPDDRTWLSGAFDWRITRDTKLTLLATYNRGKSIYDYGKPFDGSLLPNPFGRISKDLFVGEPGFDKFNIKGQTLGTMLEHQINANWKFRQNVLAFDYDADVAFAAINQRVDATQRRVGRSAFTRLDKDKGVSLDHQLQGKFTTGAFEHTVLMGIDYSDRDFNRAQRTGTLAPLDLYNPVYGAVPTLAGATNSLNNSRQTGVYLQEQVKFDKRWIGLIGARWDRARNTTDNVAVSGVVTPSSARANAFSPRLGLMYLSESGLSPYVSYTESFQPASGQDFFLRPFEPTNARQYEAGIKYEPAGANASVTLAVYELTQTNVSTADPAHPGFAIQTGEIRSRGVELEGRASLNRKLDLVGSIGTTEAKITKSNTNNVGTRPTSVPRNSASLWADYRFSDLLQGVSMGFGARYIGKQDPTTTVTMGGYTVFDAALRYQVDNWRFALNVKNLANRTYLANCSFACFYGDERNFVLSAKYSW